MSHAGGEGGENSPKGKFHPLAAQPGVCRGAGAFPNLT